jgi:uncharacterized protein YhaN
MRIGRIHLLRYGHFTDAVLDFPARQPDFHLICGPNEAGKSTAMAAIEDLLFGIPASSAYNFLHEYAAMRVGAILESGAQTLTIRRRKGNRDTLLTEQEIPVPAGDGVLAPVLGGADRRFYARMFNLDHQRLRDGGREILEARDDVGQMLFLAGTGIQGLRKRLLTMEEEAGALWAPRRSAKRRYYQAEERLNTAESGLREHVVTAAGWQEAKSAYETAVENCRLIEREIEALSSEQRKLGRIRRVARNVRRVAELEAIIHELGSVTVLPEDALARLDKATLDDANTVVRIGALSEQMDSVSQERATLVFDETLLLRAEDIKQFHERRIQIRRHKSELPKWRAALAGELANLRRLAAELEWPDGGADQLIARIPARSKLATARGVLNRRGAQLAAVENAQNALLEAAKEHSGLAARLAETTSPADVSVLAAQIRATRDLGDFDSRLAAAGKELQEAESACQRRLKSLRPHVTAAATLADLAVPALDAVRAHRDLRRDLEQRLQALRERIRTATQELGRLSSSYERITADENVVSLNELLSLRQHRDLGWSIIRRRFISGEAISDEETSAFAPAGELCEAYEAAVHDADQAADRRFAKAEAAAELTVIARRIGEQQELLDSLRTEEQVLTVEQAQLAEAWEEMWSAAAIEPLDPDTMLEWLAARQEILEQLARQEAAERQLASIREEEGRAKERLLHELAALGISPEPLAPQPLRVVLQLAADKQNDHEKRAEARRELEEAVRKAAAESERRRKALAKAELDWSAWTAQWSEALDILGLSIAAGPESAQVQIDIIDEMREVASRFNDLKHERIGKSEREMAAFAQDVRDLVQAVAPTLGALEAEDAVAELERLLTESSRAHDLSMKKDADLASLQAKIEACEADRRDALEVIRNFQVLAGVDSTDALRAAIERSDRFRAIKTEHGRLIDSLLQDGDGLPVAALAEECAAKDPDQLVAQEQTIDGRLQDLRNRLVEASEARSNARRTFEAIGGDDRAARYAADRQAALTEIKEIAESYVRLHSATLVLKWAIDRYRREKQAPLLKRAGEIFAILTGGSFVALQLEFEDDTARLAGRRPDGSAVPVSGMSTGTADQLYLALRIAAVEDYLDRAPELPFVADDLFINFDDDRAAAGFTVLGHLAAKTQVLFFTHHHHLLEIAQATLGTSLSAIMLPSQGAPQARA